MSRWKTAMMGLLFCAFSAHAEFLTPSDFEQDREVKWKALLFLSEVCPCSRGHVEHLEQIKTRYKDLKLYVVISEPASEDKKTSQVNYFEGLESRFPVIEDPEQELVNKYRALRTPHVVLFEKKTSGKFEPIYEGGVTNHKDFEDSSVHYLEENLKLLSEGHKVKHRYGRSYGCYIRRI